LRENFACLRSRHQPASLLKKPAAGGKGTELGELNYNEYNADMRSAADLLKARGLPVELDLADKFIGDRAALMGYVSWAATTATSTPRRITSSASRREVCARRRFPPAHARFSRQKGGSR
jgi:hypothetical protein